VRSTVSQASTYFDSAKFHLWFLTVPPFSNTGFQLRNSQYSFDYNQQPLFY